MADYMFVKDAAVLWNISERQVSGLCTRGRIPGAVKQGRSWMIPTTAEKPADQRIKSGAYMRTAKTAKLPLPIGISDYRLASSDYYYIDKTMMIKDFIDERPMVSLFTRPRRFGKTLNMDMLRVFFEKTDEDTFVYFKDKKIWACGEQYRAYQGKYPVIYVTFKDVKCEDWESTYALIFQILRNEVQRHSELLSSDRISSYDKKYLESILDGTASEIDVAMLFMNLSRILDVHYDKAPIIIIDEYDTPIQQGHTQGYYEKVITFMRNLFSGGLKDNRHLSFGFLTGVLFAAENSLLSGVNNLSVNSILDNKYSSYFGFTPDEAEQMASYYGVTAKYNEIREWYGGYYFGNSEVFNPWSVVNYLHNDFNPKLFCLSADTIRELIAQIDADSYDKLSALADGKTIVTFIDTGATYPHIRENPSSLFSLLLLEGYLTIVRAIPTCGFDSLCELAVPNKEVSFIYDKKIMPMVRRANQHDDNSNELCYDIQ